MEKLRLRLLVTSSELEADRQLLTAFTALGLRCDDSVVERCTLLLGGLELSRTLNLNTNPEDLVAAWHALMASSKPSEDVAILLALAAMLAVFYRGNSELVAALVSRGWNLNRTVSEVAFRLFGATFNMGRRLITSRTQRKLARALLEEAIAIASLINVAAHSRKAQMQFHGRRGVAYLLLARGSDVGFKPAFLQSASEDLALSRKLGDRSPQHFEYEIEVLLRRYQLDPDDCILNIAEQLLAEAGLVSRRLAYNGGDLELARGIFSDVLRAP